MENPVEIKVNSIATAQNIKHVYYQCQSSQKYETLKIIIEDPDFFMKNPSIFKFMVSRYRRTFKDLNLESERLESKELAKDYMLRMFGSLDETNFSLWVASYLVSYI
jgi:hypothetical protein